MHAATGRDLPNDCFPAQADGAISRRQHSLPCPLAGVPASQSKDAQQGRLPQATPGELGIALMCPSRPSRRLPNCPPAALSCPLPGGSPLTLAHMPLEQWFPHLRVQRRHWQFQTLSPGGHFARPRPLLCPARTAPRTGTCSLVLAPAALYIAAAWSRGRHLLTCPPSEASSLAVPLPLATRSQAKPPCPAFPTLSLGDRD